MNVALQDDSVSSELILGLNEMNEVSYLQGYFLSSLKVVDVLHKQHWPVISSEKNNAHYEGNAKDHNLESTREVCVL